MKKTMVFIFILALLLGCLTACGSDRNNNDQQNKPAATPGLSPTPVPEDDNGLVNDGNGIIGDSDNGADSSTGTDEPGVGQDIEDGVNDVVDGVEDALDGNDNPARRRMR